jgi:hypothetical protein
MPKTFYDLRVWETQVEEILPPGVGKRMGDSSVFRAVIEANSPIAEHVRRAITMRRVAGNPLTAMVADWREYSPEELASAELLSARPTAGFQPPAEHFGDVYDYTDACQICRVGRRQMSDLTLDLAKVPRKDAAITIGMELVVSERFVELVEMERLSGLSFRPIQHARESRKAPPPRWQLVEPEPSVEILSPPTVFGNDPFDLDEAGEYQCPNGHVPGLNIVSEVTVARASWSGDDLTTTRQHSGNPWPADPSADVWSYGYQVPTPVDLISPRLYRLIREHKLTGWQFEVAYLA